MIRKIGWALVAILIGIQFYRPSVEPVKIAEPSQDLYAMVPDLLPLVRTSCYDCHSNESKLPWYSHINPPGILVRRHIIEAREHLNFSLAAEWKQEDWSHVMEECAEEVEEGHMPISNYLWLHPEARLTEADRSAMVNMFKQLGKQQHPLFSTRQINEVEEME